MAIGSKKKVFYTEKDYIPNVFEVEELDLSSLEISRDLFIDTWQEKKESDTLRAAALEALNVVEKPIEIQKENFVVKVHGSVKHAELEKELSRLGLESYLKGPADYSISRILSENWSNDYRNCLGLDLKHSNDMITKTGGQTIKNVSGYDLKQIYIGSYNSLAIITSAYLRVGKLPEYEADMLYFLDSYDPKLMLNKFSHWDDTEIDFFYGSKYKSVNEKAFTLRIKLKGSRDLVDLRKAKVENILGEAHHIDEHIYETKGYPAIEGMKLEFVVRSSQLEQLVNLFSSRFNSTDMQVSPKTGILTMHIKSTAELRDFQSNFEKIKANMQSLKYRALVYPVNFKNKILERKINIFENKVEKSLIKKLKRTYDPDNKLNPGILVEAVGELN